MSCRILFMLFGVRTDIYLYTSFLRNKFVYFFWFDISESAFPALVHVFAHQELWCVCLAVGKWTKFFTNVPNVTIRWMVLTCWRLAMISEGFGFKKAWRLEMFDSIIEKMFFDMIFILQNKTKILFTKMFLTYFLYVLWSIGICVL